MMNEVSFFLNGKAVTVDCPSPDLMLIDYLRAPDVSLAGPKKGCGQGGCGACTVILSEWNTHTNKPEHRAINSCLRPICALGGMVVTTIEGTGAARRPPPKSITHARTMGRGGIPFEDPHPANVDRVQLHVDANRAAAYQSEARTLQQSSNVPSAKLDSRSNFILPVKCMRV